MENNKPSWIDEDNDTSTATVPAESTTTAVQPSSYSKNTGEVTSWFSKPRGAANSPPTKAAPESKADPVKIQGTNPARTNDEGDEGGWTGDWQPSWSKPAKHEPSSPPDVEAARPEATTTRPRVSTTASNGPGNQPLDVDQETLNAMSRAHWAVKILYMSACVLMGAAAGLSLGSLFSLVSRHVIFLRIFSICINTNLTTTPNQPNSTLLYHSTHDIINLLTSIDLQHQHLIQPRHSYQCRIHFFCMLCFALLFAHVLF